MHNGGMDPEIGLSDLGGHDVWKLQPGPNKSLVTLPLSTANAAVIAVVANKVAALEMEMNFQHFASIGPIQQFAPPYFLSQQVQQQNLQSSQDQALNGGVPPDPFSPHGIQFTGPPAGLFSAQSSPVNQNAKIKRPRATIRPDGPEDPNNPRKQKKRAESPPGSPGPPAAEPYLRVGYEFTSLDKAKEVLERYARTNHFEIITKRSSRDRTRCSRAGKPRSKKTPPAKQRDRRSTKCGCEWRVRGKWYIAGEPEAGQCPPGPMSHGSSVIPSLENRHSNTERAIELQAGLQGGMSRGDPNAPAVPSVLPMLDARLDPMDNPLDNDGKLKDYKGPDKEDKISSVLITRVSLRHTAGCQPSPNQHDVISRKRGGMLPQKIVQGMIDLIKIGCSNKHLRNWLEASWPDYHVSAQALANVRARVKHDKPVRAPEVLASLSTLVMKKPGLAYETAVGNGDDDDDEDPLNAEEPNQNSNSGAPDSISQQLSIPPLVSAVGGLTSSSSLSSNSQSVSSVTSSPCSSCGGAGCTFCMSQPGLSNRGHHPNSLTSSFSYSQHGYQHHADHPCISCGGNNPESCLVCQNSLAQLQSRQIPGGMQHSNIQNHQIQQMQSMQQLQFQGHVQNGFAVLGAPMPGMQPIAGHHQNSSQSLQTMSLMPLQAPLQSVQLHPSHIQGPMSNSMQIQNLQMQNQMLPNQIINQMSLQNSQVMPTLHYLLPSQPPNMILHNAIPNQMIMMQGPLNQVGMPMAKPTKSTKPKGPRAPGGAKVNKSKGTPLPSLPPLGGSAPPLMGSPSDQQASMIGMVQSMDPRLSGMDPMNPGLNDLANNLHKRKRMKAPGSLDDHIMSSDASDSVISDLLGPQQPKMRN